MTPVEEFFNKFHDKANGRFTSTAGVYPRSFKGYFNKRRDEKKAADRLLKNHDAKVRKATKEVQKLNARPRGFVALPFVSERMQEFFAKIK